MKKHAYLVFSVLTWLLVASAPAMASSFPVIDGLAAAIITVVGKIALIGFIGAIAGMIFMHDHLGQVFGKLLVTAFGCGLLTGAVAFMSAIGMVTN